MNTHIIIFNKKFTQKSALISMNKFSIIILLFVSFTASSQIKKTLQIISDTTKIVGFDSSGNQLILKNGTEKRTNAFLKNKLGGITEFNYAVDSVWVEHDTLFVQRAILHKFKLNSTNNSIQNIFTNGLVISNDTIRHGGNLNTNTSINLNNNNYTIKQDSTNYTAFSPSIFSSRRAGTNTKTSFEQRNAYFLTTVSNNNIIQSQLLLNDTISTLKYKNTAITLNDQKVVYNAKQHSFNGDWLKIPEKTQTQLDSLSLFRPAGSLIYNKTTKGLYVSDGNTMTPSAIEYLDGSEIQTVTPTSWATNNGIGIPLFRIRHPNNVSGLNNSKSINQDFKIIPYQYGMAIEYNGVLENWVGEFSIHKGSNYYDMGDGGQGWGGVLWIGDDYDSGGLRFTARNSTFTGGNIKWTEISSEQFSSASAGNIRLRLVDSTDRIDFVTGTRGSTKVYGSIGTSGIKFPSVGNVNRITNPLKGLTVFDNSDSTLKVYNGLDWNNINNSDLMVGKSGIKFPAVNNISAILTPLKGLTVFDNFDSTLKVYNGHNWNVLNVNNRLGADTININTTFTDLTKQVQYVNASNGNIIIILPPISNNLSGLIFKIIKTDNSSNSVKVVTNGLNSINGVIFKEIQIQYECMNLYSNGINEWIATKESSY
jgi:hypothetical protein